MPCKWHGFTWQVYAYLIVINYPTQRLLNWRSPPWDPNCENLIWSKPRLEPNEGFQPLKNIAFILLWWFQSKIWRCMFLYISCALGFNNLLWNFFFFKLLECRLYKMVIQNMFNVNINIFFFWQTNFLWLVMETCDAVYMKHASG